MERDKIRMNPYGAEPEHTPGPSIEQASRLRAARGYRDAGDLDRARREAELAIEEGGRSADAVSFLADIAYRQGRPADARAMAEEVLGRLGENAVAHAVLGKVALAGRDFARASSHFADAVRLFDNPYYAERWIHALWMAGRADDALARLGEYRRRYPEAVALIKREVWLLRERGEIERARRLLEELLEKTPGDGGARRLLMELRAAEKKPEDRVREMEAVLRVKERGEDPSLRAFQAKNRKAAGDLEGAAREYAEALRLEPSNLYYRKQLGFIYKKMGRLARAIQELRIAFLEDPGDLYVRSALFAAYREKADTAGLVEAIDEALGRHPEKVFLHGLRRKFAPPEAEA